MWWQHFLAGWFAVSLIVGPLVGRHLKKRGEA